MPPETERENDFYRPFAQGAAFAAHAAELARDYRSAQPFAHIVVDGMFRPDVLHDVVAEIPSPFAERDRLFARDIAQLQEHKFAFRDVAALGPASLALINTLNAKPFLEFLSTLTGIAGLIPDPYLEGGGFHQIVRGGLLAVHADFNTHSIMRTYRRLNLLLYLNAGWNTDWGGDLELPTRGRSS